MPVWSQSSAQGEPPIFSSHARHYRRAENASGGFITGSALTDAGLIPCQLTRTVSEASMLEYGLTASEAGRVKMPLQYWNDVSIGDELQIDGMRWAVLTSPMRHAAVPQIAHCEVMVRTAQAVGE